MIDNKAIGSGANPTRPGTPGGGSGGAIFFVSNNNTGTLTIQRWTLHHNPSAGFETRGFPGIFFQSFGHHPAVTGSTIN